MDAFHAIPYETNLIWASYLSPREICTISQVSRYWNEISKDDFIWKYWCGKHFCKEKSNSEKEKSNIDEEVGWAVTYQEMFKSYGKYISCYGRVRKAWNRIESWLRRFSPPTLASLEPGLTEQQIESAPCSAQRELPLDVLCSLRIHNGQNENGEEDTFGLFGACSAYDYTINMRLLRSQDLHAPSYKWLTNALMLARSLNDYIYFVVLKDFTDGAFQFKRGMIVDHTADFERPVFLANSFTEFLENYAADLHRGRYDVVAKRIIMIPSLASDGSDMTTHGVRVRANAIFMPQRSSFNYNSAGQRTGCNYFFIYRIRISMSKDEDAKKKCVLRTRHWRIMDENGTIVDRVDGPGVVGWYPRAFPGSYFEYCSCTNQHNPRMFMGGHFIFDDEENNGIEVTIGQFPLFVR
eukprot:Phypoly_transcript_10071.p1 GENE.Phypoly_transcript_10071~~Phypoly_transcript_10071.p1  ORF type:complete len:428 (+),score=54.64 Phypoly_transcript_10071:59-1285(+)